MHPSDRPTAVARALSFIDDPRADDFDAVAREVFAFQFERNAPYRRLCERRGRTPDTVRSAAEIPHVPVRAFRRADLTCAEPRVVFRTSGTTGGDAERGRHLLPETALYEAAWPPVFRDHLLPDRDTIRIASLVPAAREALDSSLAWMIDGVLRRFGAPGSGVYMGAGGLDETGLRAAMGASSTSGEPLMLIGTAFAFVHLLDGLVRDGLRYALPPGSRLMDTGGFKGRSREVSRAALLEAYAERLGIPSSRVAGEYGMTELSSQRYERTLSDATSGLVGGGREYVGPPWLRSRALDPETLVEVPPGTPGLLAHLDLANAWTVAAVVTEDVGTVTSRGLTILGRAAGAELRGCSLATEELLGDA